MRGHGIIILRQKGTNITDMIPLNDHPENQFPFIRM